MALIASLSASPGARLKENVTAGNWPWWLTASGAVAGPYFATALNGTTVVPGVAVGVRLGVARGVALTAVVGVAPRVAVLVIPVVAAVLVTPVVALDALLTVPVDVALGAPIPVALAGRK